MDTVNKQNTHYGCLFCFCSCAQVVEPTGKPESQSTSNRHIRQAMDSLDKRGRFLVHGSQYRCLDQGVANPETTKSQRPLGWPWVKPSTWPAFIVVPLG